MAKAPKYLLISLSIILFYGTVSFSIPTYTDEIFYKISSGRFFIDQFVIINYWPQCHNGLVENIPWFFYFQKILTSLFYNYFSVALLLKIFGFISFLSWTIVLCRKLIKEHYSVGLAAFGLLGLGVLPLLLYVNRPEQNLIWLMLLLWLISFQFQVKREYKIGAIFILVLLALPTHAKSLLTLPGVFISLHFVTKKYKEKISYFFLLFYFYISSFFYFSKSCTEAPVLQGILANISISPLDIIHQSARANISRLWNSIWFTPLWDNLKLTKEYQGNWLPYSFSDSGLIEIVNILISAVGFISCALLLLYFCVIVFDFLVKKRELKNDRLLFLGFYTTLLSTNFIMNSTTFYRSAYIIPLTSLLLGMTLIEMRKFRFIAKITPFLSYFFASVAILSTITIASKIITQSKNNSSIMINEDLRKQSVELADRCQLNLENNHNIFVDQEMLLLLWNKMSRPIPSNYTTGWWGRDIKDIKQYLIKVNSPGALLACPQAKQYFDNILEKGNICCWRNGLYKSN